jgi:hypothetical protein
MIAVMIKTNVSQKVAVVALFVVLTFAVTGLSVVTLLSESFVVAQMTRERIDPISHCFQIVRETTITNQTAATNATTTTTNQTAATNATTTTTNQTAATNATTTTTNQTAAPYATTTTNATTMEVGTGDIQNWTESVQNFDSLIPTSNDLTLINENVAGGSGPITDMAGIWNVLINGNMTAHDRLIVLDEVNSLLAASQPGFTQIQQDALSRCITGITNALPPTPNY